MCYVSETFPQICDQALEFWGRDGDEFLRMHGNVGIAPEILLPAWYADEANPVTRSHIRTIARDLKIRLRRSSAERATRFCGSIINGQ